MQKRTKGNGLKLFKAKKCKWCKEAFIPVRPLQTVCGATCGYHLAMEQRRKVVVKSWKIEKAFTKEKLKTHKDYLKDLQKVFNTFIRLRDKHENCISCDCSMQNRKGDASHFFSVGGNANLRFDEDNVHLSCVTCNQFRHGNIAEYAVRLPGRIGKKRFEQLQERRNAVSKLSINEIKAKVFYYKEKVKELSQTP